MNTSTPTPALADLRVLAATQSYRNQPQRAAAFETIDAAAQALDEDVLRAVAAELGCCSTSTPRHLAADVAQALRDEVGGPTPAPSARSRRRPRA